MIIDQHRAHVRILLIVTLRRSPTGKVKDSGCCSGNHSVAGIRSRRFEGIMDDLSAVGLNWPIWGGSFAVNSIPSGVEGSILCSWFVTWFTLPWKRQRRERRNQNVLALTLVKAAAIVYGQVLTPDEITGLVDNLFACETLIIRRMAAWLFQP